MEFAGSPRILGSRSQLPLLTLSIAAQQFAWGVEQAYVSRYLLELGIAPQNLSLVWIAGPTCGLLVQPIVGAVSDFSTSHYGRRRPFMMTSALLCAAGLLLFSWAPDIAPAWPLVCSIIGVLIVDVSINVCGATSRALIVDVMPAHDQTLANAWAGRMSAWGHLLSYLLCATDVSGLAGNQIQSVCLVASVLLVLGVGITCGAVSERYLVSRHSISAQISLVAKTTFKAASNLDYVLASIFKVQLLGWYAWFTTLFFGAEWAAEIWRSQNPYASPDQVARAGSRALLAFSVSASVWSYALPLLQRDIRQLWSWSYLVYALTAFSAYWVHSYSLVVTCFALIGIPWAMTCWAPFALTATRIHQLPREPLPSEIEQPDEEILSVNSSTTSEYDSFGEKSGIYLGLHNTAITLPQFLSTFGSWLVFRIMDARAGDSGGAIAVSLQVGSFTALLAAHYAAAVDIVE